MRAKTNRRTVRRIQRTSSQVTLGSNCSAGSVLLAYVQINASGAQQYAQGGTDIANANTLNSMAPSIVASGFDPTSALAAGGGGLAFTVILGMIGAWRILGETPAAFLREL